MIFADLNLDLIKDPVEKRLTFLAWLTQMIKDRGCKSTPVLVGGGAVEFYTAGNYATKDIDIVFDDIRLINEILIPEGFKKEGRYWYNDDHDIILECPGSEYPERTLEVDVNGIKVSITALEEIIVDRLCAAKFWTSRSDRDWAKTMLESKIPFSLDYLRRRAEGEDVSDLLDLILKEGVDNERRDNDL